MTLEAWIAVMVVAFIIWANMSKNKEQPPQEPKVIDAVIVRSKP